MERQGAIFKPALLSLMPAPIYLVARFVIKYGYFPNIIRPCTFNEKILTKLLFDRDPILTLTADKIQAREFIRSRVGNNYQPNLLCIWNKADDVAIDPAWGRAVLKANHGSLFNEFIPDTTSANNDELRRIAAGWMAINYGRKYSEWAYRHVEPRVFAEEWIGDDSPDEFIDYKIFCFAGVPRFIKILVGLRGRLRYRYCDIDFKPIDAVDVVEGRELLDDKDLKVPKNYSEMLKVAACLSAQFDFLRVDLYNIDGRIFVGELTHYPNAGAIPLSSHDADRYLGSFWESSTMSYLPKLY